MWVKPQGGWATSDTDNAELQGTDVGYSDDFGWSVAVDGSTVVVGSPQQDSYEVGAAYIFVEPQGGWTDMKQTAELTPLTFPDQGDFGHLVVISGNVILGGAPFNTVQHLQQGAVFASARQTRESGKHCAPFPVSCPCTTLAFDS